jgi:hypothetical protein
MYCRPSRIGADVVLAEEQLSVIVRRRRFGELHYCIPSSLESAQDSSPGIGTARVNPCVDDFFRAHFSSWRF